MYTPLYVKTNYSLLSSLITIDNYIEYAKEHNISSLCITDSNLFGMMKFYRKCKDNNIKPIIGLEITIDGNIILLYAKNYQGYKTLIKLSTIIEENKLTFDDIKKYNNEVIGIVPIEYLDLYNNLVDIIPELYIGYSNKTEEKDALKITKNVVFVRKNLYILDTDKNYLKYLYMIRDGITTSDDNDYKIDNFNLDIDDIYQYTSNENLFNTIKISDKCNLEFPPIENLLPVYSDTDGLSSSEYLKQLSSLGLKKRLNGKVSDKYVKRLYYEIDVIDKMGFSNYFLVVYDFIKYAKKNKILVGPGRGSGAGSLVCYCLGITDIDPLKYNLLFERFLNPERKTMPDIDTDFPDIYREQVINYVKEKYGIKRVSGIVTFDTLASRQALRDVGRVLNVASYQLDLLTKKISNSKEKLSSIYSHDKDFADLINSDDKLKLLYKVSSYIEGYPRHTSIHAAGVVLSSIDLDEVIPLTISNGMYLSSFTYEYLEDLGLLKMDFLGLKTLTTIMNIISDIKKYENIEIDFNNIPLDDKDTLKLFADGKTLGIFQFESSGMKSFLKKLKPDSLNDIFAAIALYRPGPANSIDSFIKRKHGLEKIDYLDLSLESILKDTYGIITYQEDVINISVKLAGYTLGEADILRSAMSKKKKDVLLKEKEKFISRSISNGHSKELSEKIYNLILNFAGYGFNKSHAVSYSMVAYKMAYLKCHYPKYFYNSLLSSDNGKITEYIREAKSLGINILKPDINKSDINYVIDKDGLYFPLSSIRNIGAVTSKEIIDLRGNGFTDIFDFLYKVPNVNKKTLEVLILSGCFDCFNINRNTLINNLDELLNYRDLVSSLDKEYVLKPELINYDEFSKEDLINKEKELFGFYLSNHPVTTYKVKYSKIVSLSDIEKYFNKNIDCVVLIEKTKTINTKKGEKMMFVTGSDEEMVREFTIFPKIYKDNSYLKIGDIVLINGHVEKRYNDYQIIVNSLEKLN